MIGAITKGANLRDDQALKILNFLKIKDLKELKENFKNPITQEGIKELEELFEVLKFGNYSDQVKTNFTIVRGLDYYCHTAFEFTTNELGAQGTVLAGGRYDGLTKILGGSDVPGVGWAGGIERIMLLMQDVQIVFDNSRNLHQAKVHKSLLARQMVHELHLEHRAEWFQAVYGIFQSVEVLVYQSHRLPAQERL